MPQKKNPDVPELIRGKSGRVYGNLICLLTLMKSQPLAYNKDNQEDKEPLFDSVDTLLASVRLYTDMLDGLQVKEEIMLEAAARGFSTATALAAYLVRKGVAFRDAHEVVGLSVRFCIDNDKDLPQCTLDELQQFSDVIEQDVYEVLTLDGSVSSRNHFGGTAPDQLRAAVVRATVRLSK